MPSRRSLATLAILAFLTFAETAKSGQDEQSGNPIGFAPGSRSAQAKAEARALAVPDPEHARSWLRTLTAEPHLAGSAADHKTALFVRDKLREWGWQAEIAEYEVLLNEPSSDPLLMLTQPIEKALPIVETPIPGDKDSASKAASPAFHGYGISGTANGQVVYANYGRPEDFAALEKMGVEVKGKIILARYGELFRGLKVREAQKRGAKGILIYSDPADDGYAKGDTYPDGPYRPGSAIQRGSVQFLSLGPGDPSTPNGPSIKGAKRLPIDPLNGFPLRPQELAGPVFHSSYAEASARAEAWEKATGLVRDDYFASIPSLPLSYDAALPILESLDGPNVPNGWQGGLPLAYHVGPGAAEVGFQVSMKYAVKPIWNVIATIQGSVEPDRWVMIGNHRDAWVYGAVDPGSGTAATLEACRAIGAAVKHGWKPRRTLVYASWDAEEYGLVGSTEWAEDHAKEIDEKAALMLNVDSAVAGPEPDFDGIPSLRDLLLDAAGAVLDVRSGQSLRKVWTAAQRASWARTAPIELFDPVWDPAPAVDGSASAEAVTRARFVPQLNWLGSGSDYTAFVDHCGVPALDVGFKGRYGVYHSIYDNFTWMERFGDPEFVLHTTAARLYTAIAMRAAGAEVLPLTFVPYGEALREHVDDLRRIVERKARAIEPDSDQTALTFVGLPKLVRAVRAFQAQAAILDRATEALASRDGVALERLKTVNDLLMRIERAFLLPKGLPERPWFKHAIYAPGTTTGYASWPLPGIRQPILAGDTKALAAQLPVLVERIEAATRAMKATTDAATDRELPKTRP
jgi:N-acetylated-alpha-linked acidic dipeptidase